MSLNLAVLLRESARRRPDHTAIIADEHRLTWAELDAAADRMAEGLRRHGLSPGDTVALQLPNVPQFAIAWFGILKAGLVAVPMNVLFKDREVAYVLAHSEARTLLTWQDCAEAAAKGAAEAGVTDVFTLGRPDAEDLPGRPFEELLADPPDDPDGVLVPRDPGDVAAVVYTAGTTGRPKGAELTHFQLFMNADTPGRLFGIRDDDVVMVALPLFHVFALSSQLDVCARFGATMTLVPRFEPGRVLEVMERDGVTVFEGVPTMYVALLEHPDRATRDLQALRVGISGGAPMPAEVLDSVEREFGIVVLEGYGLSETASTTTFNSSAEDRRIYSAGKPIYGVDVEVRNPDGHRLPHGPDHLGELVVRGVNVMRGYRGDPETTAATLVDGWLHTGDRGYIDEDGFVFVVGRTSELIIRGGYNIHPREVEDVLYTHPAVREAAVIGIPDHRLGQEVHAVVALRPGADASEQELIAYVRERVASYKYPRSVEFRDELPTGASGKILKRAL
ncbi:long-chain-fatty-acid--CoA ligase [Actinomycetospora lemnae]|uniref:Long-chain fatty acid--CoA ligase n=1 Tax=Actinomycetospora lemnae TaxID=3019891 RepID=A0ABT5SYM9_9PSEU|nr:long-chain fatty acid--CoA ligase [Actinomycetospora sp. DW7H6]MDD7967965.1 long-chain fatty acid--CoA ligase [Actinomycetospora sp. DW7H6]